MNEKAETVIRVRLGRDKLRILKNCTRLQPLAHTPSSAGRAFMARVPSVPYRGDFGPPMSSRSDAPREGAATSTYGRKEEASNTLRPAGAQ